jgi:hypothetical protein
MEIDIFLVVSITGLLWRHAGSQRIFNTALQAGAFFICDPFQQAMSFQDFISVVHASRIHSSNSKGGVCGDSHIMPHIY